LVRDQTAASVKKSREILKGAYYSLAQICSVAIIRGVSVINILYILVNNQDTDKLSLLLSYISSLEETVLNMTSEQNIAIAKVKPNWDFFADVGVHFNQINQHKQSANAAGWSPTNGKL
jgi:hypothetical protein